MPLVVSAYFTALVVRGRESAERLRVQRRFQGGTLLCVVSYKLMLGVRCAV